MFNVPRYRFEQESDVFKTMFTLPQAVSSMQDGQSREHPLTLTGVTSDEFRALLKVLYPK